MSEVAGTKIDEAFMAAMGVVNQDGAAIYKYLNFDQMALHGSSSSRRRRDERAAARQGKHRARRHPQPRPPYLAAR